MYTQAAATTPYSWQRRPSAAVTSTAAAVAPLAAREPEAAVTASTAKPFVAPRPRPTRAHSVVDVGDQLACVRLAVESRQQEALRPATAVSVSSRRAEAEAVATQTPGMQPLPAPALDSAPPGDIELAFDELGAGEVANIADAPPLPLLQNGNPLTLTNWVDFSAKYGETIPAKTAVHRAAPGVQALATC
jgi:hypothetical protein